MTERVPCEVLEHPVVKDATGSDEICIVVIVAEPRSDCVNRGVPRRGQELGSGSLERGTDRPDATVRPRLLRDPVCQIVQIQHLTRAEPAGAKRRSGAALIDEDARKSMFDPEAILAGDTAVD